ncbi:MAG: hypothetical protein COA78_36270 [Blastopirellula sp.]|nr:MAG: hypothetical protein COA78_36270 [Blastopirellula sp.]
MTNQNDIHQQMLELIYGLLPDEESEALATRIGSDPQLARKYAELSQQTTLLAAVVKQNKPKRPDYDQWKKLAEEPETTTTNTESFETDTVAFAPKRKAGRFVSGLRALSALAASLVILFVGYQYLRPDSLLTESGLALRTEIALDKHLAVDILAPAVLEHGIDNRFFVSIVNAKEEAADAEVELIVTSGSGNELYRETQQATGGTLGYSLPAESLALFSKDESVKLSINARNSYGLSQLELPLPTRPQSLVTSLALDRSVVKAGEPLFIRSVTLSSTTQQEASTEVRFSISDGEGNALLGDLEDELTVRGVAANEFILPNDAMRGRYRVTAQTSGKSSFNDYLYFDVEVDEKPVWIADIGYNKQWFDSGEDVKANIRLTTPAGLPVRNQKLQVQQVVDGKYLDDQVQTVETSDEGVVELDFKLADNAKWGRENDLFLYDEANNWGFVQAIPVATDEVDVQFYPEGGKLISGFDNRVYFQAIDAQQQPVNIQGTIVDSNGKSVADVQATTLGRGFFNFEPAENLSNYRLELGSVDKNSRSFELPAVQPSEDFGLNISNSVSAADDKLQIHVASKVPNQRLGVIAYNNDVPVAQHFWYSNKTAPSIENIELEIPEEIAGVSRITLYKSELKEVTPLAERLVYRKPTKQVRLVTNRLSEEYPIGGLVELEVVAVDENNQPLDVVLGIKVVNESAYARTREADWSLDRKQFLGIRLARADQIEDASKLLPGSDGLPQRGGQQLRQTHEMQLQLGSLQREQEKLQQKLAGRARPGNEPQAIPSQIESWDEDFGFPAPVDADQQLDLFLGTDGWTNIHVEELSEAEMLYASNSSRTLVAQEELDQVAGYDSKDADADSYDSPSLDLKFSQNTFGNTIPTIQLEGKNPTGLVQSDNRDIAHSAFQREVAGYQNQTEQLKSLSGTVLVVGGAIVCLSMVVLLLCRSAGSAWVWGPGISLSIGCLVWGLSLAEISSVSDVGFERIAMNFTTTPTPAPTTASTESPSPVMSINETVSASKSASSDEAKELSDYGGYGEDASQPFSSIKPAYGDAAGLRIAPLAESENKKVEPTSGVGPSNEPSRTGSAVSGPVESTPAITFGLTAPAASTENRPVPATAAPAKKPASGERKGQGDPAPAGKNPLAASAPKQNSAAPDPASSSRFSLNKDRGSGKKAEAESITPRSKGVAGQATERALTDSDSLPNYNALPGAPLVTDAMKLKRANKEGFAEKDLAALPELRSAIAPANSTANKLAKKSNSSPQKKEYYYQRQLQERNREELKRSDMQQSDLKRPDQQQRARLAQQDSDAATTEPHASAPQPQAERQPVDAISKKLTEGLVGGGGGAGGGFGGKGNSLAEKVPTTKSRGLEALDKLEDKSDADIEFRGKAMKADRFSSSIEDLTEMKSERWQANRKKIISREYAYSGTALRDKRSEEFSKKQGASKSPETIYWHPFLETGKAGKATFSFLLPPEPGKYRISIDAHANGRLGSSRHTFEVIVPSSASEKSSVDSKKGKTSSKK